MQLFLKSDEKNNNKYKTHITLIFTYMVIFTVFFICSFGIQLLSTAVLSCILKDSF